MKLVFEFKCFILCFLQFITNGRTTIIHPGEETLNLRGHKVRNAQEAVALHWPKGIVTYYLDNLVYDNFVAERVREAMNALERASCVRFKHTLDKPTGNSTWVHFTNPQAERYCVHEPKFKNNGEIVVILGFDCLKAREILHTLLHAIGFKDEVTHPHRDQYIRIMWNNIQPEYRHLYRIQSSDVLSSTLLVEYDPLSIMHFHDRAFSMNGHATVMPLVPGLLISPSDDLSQLDKMRLRLLFDHECNKRKVGDMIDTCKMLVSKNSEPNNTKNVTVPESNEENIKGEVIESDKENKTEILKGKIQTKFNSIENDYDSDESNSDNGLEKLETITIIHKNIKDSGESNSLQDDKGSRKSESEKED